MKIGYLGNFGPIHSTESHISWTLEDMGHEVVRFQEVGQGAVAAEDVALRLHELGMVLWTRTPPGLKGDAQRMLIMADRMGVPTVAVHLDLFAGLERSKDIDREPWWNCKYVFTADGGSDAFWMQHGINHFWSPPAVVKKEAYMASPNGRQYDVIFTGQRDYHHEYKFRPKLVDWLEKTYGSRFHRFPMPGEHAVRNHELNVLYASAKVCVGDSLVLPGRGYYWSDRLPETTGRGGFIIFPEIEGVRDWYSEEELVTYPLYDLDALKERIDYYLQNDNERERIRVAGHEATKRHSLYHHRLEKVLETVFGA